MPLSVFTVMQQIHVLKSAMASINLCSYELHGDLHVPVCIFEPVLQLIYFFFSQGNQQKMK